MTAPVDAKPSSKGRKRGGPLRINQRMIVDVARKLDPQTLTMQAVADELGVDRKALNYHVTDRDGLLRLVAAGIFETTFAQGFGAHFEVAGVTAEDDWRTVLRVWAVCVRDSMVATGVVSNYFRLDDNLAVFEPAELVLQQMLAAGFDLDTAGRGLAFVTHFAMAVARDVIMETEFGEHPQAPEVRRVLEHSGDRGGYEAFRALAALEINGPHDIDSQFEFELSVCIAGLERHIDAAPATRAHTSQSSAT